MARISKYSFDFRLFAVVIFTEIYFQFWCGLVLWEDARTTFARYGDHQPNSLASAGLHRLIWNDTFAHAVMSIFPVRDSY